MNVISRTMHSDHSSVMTEGRGPIPWQDRLPDPRATLLVLRRNIWTFLIVFGLFVSAVGAWVYTRTPIFAATSSLLVEARGQKVVDIESVSPELSPTTDIVDTEVRLIKSPTIAERVAAKFVAKYPSAAPNTPEGRAKLATDLLNTIDVARVASTYVIEITSRTTLAAHASDIANLFAAEVVDANREAKSSANSNANQWLRTRVAELERDAAAADDALQAYKIKHNLMSANGASLTEQQLSMLTQQILEAEEEVTQKMGILSAAQAGGGGGDAGLALTSPTIGVLRANEAAISARVAQLKTQFGDLYPPLRAARAELSNVQGQIQAELNRVMSKLQGDVREAQTRLAALKRSREQSSQVLATNNEAAVGLAELQRRADAANAVYQTFLNRLRETSAQEGLQQADLRVAETAEEPTFAESPRYRIMMLGGVVGGGLLALFAVGLAEYVSAGVRNKADVERRLRVRYAGAIPTLASTLENIRPTEPPHDYVVTHPLSLFAEVFRSIRAFLLLGGEGIHARPRVVAVASPLPQEGKSTTAICIARTSAMGGSTSVIVDCDLRRRGASTILKYESKADLCDYIAGTATLDEVLCEDTQTGLKILGVSKTPAAGQDPLSGEAMQKLVAELRTRFQVVVLDTAPVLGIADARAVAAAADRVLLITRWKTTSMRASEAAIDLLLDAGAKISGLALTQVDMKKYASGDYSETLGYSKKFRGYYTE